MLDWLATERRASTSSICRSRCCIGLAEPLRRALGVPVCCTLQGEDLFLDSLGEP